jgi:hypothetical protein
VSAWFAHDCAAASAAASAAVHHGPALQQEAAHVDGEDHHREDRDHADADDDGDGAALVVPVRQPFLDHSHRNEPLRSGESVNAGMNGMLISNVEATLAGS